MITHQTLSSEGAGGGGGVEGIVLSNQLSLGILSAVERGGCGLDLEQPRLGRVVRGARLLRGLRRDVELPLELGLAQRRRLQLLPQRLGLLLRARRLLLRHHAARVLLVALLQVLQLLLQRADRGVLVLHVGGLLLDLLHVEPVAQQVVLQLVVLLARLRQLRLHRRRRLQVGERVRRLVHPGVERGESALAELGALGQRVHLLLVLLEQLLHPGQLLRVAALAEGAVVRAELLAALGARLALVGDAERLLVERRADAVQVHGAPRLDHALHRGGRAT